MNIEAIKIDLTTSNLTQKQIAEKHGVSPLKICKINTGYIHPEIEPKTESQINRERKRSLNISRNSRVIPEETMIQNNRLQLSLHDQEDLDLLFKQLNEKPGWPKVICIDTSDAESFEWAKNMLTERKRRLEVKLAKCLLMINALETDDYSDLPSSCEAELNKYLSEPREVTESEERPQPPQSQ